MNSIGGAVKKTYEIIGKKSICGIKRVIYKRVSKPISSKIYMRHKGKYCQVKNFVSAMVAAGKWKKAIKTVKKKSPKECKSNQHRNPATGRCIKNKIKKSPKKKGRPRKKSARQSNRQGSY
mgnify:FL=1